MTVAQEGNGRIVLPQCPLQAVLQCKPCLISGDLRHLHSIYRCIGKELLYQLRVKRHGVGQIGIGVQEILFSRAVGIRPVGPNGTLVQMYAPVGKL